MSHTPNRRALVAGLAAAPAAALPAISGEFPAPAKSPDPVFQAIARERVAYAKWKAASDVNTRAEEAWFDVKKQFPGSVDLDFDGFLFSEGGTSYSDPERIEGKFAMLRRYHENDPAELAAVEQRREQALSELAARMERRNAEKERIGLPEADEANREALSEWCAAEREVLATAPTSREGAISLANFTAQILKEDGQDSENIIPALENLAVFLSGGADV